MKFDPGTICSPETVYRENGTLYSEIRYIPRQTGVYIVTPKCMRARTYPYNVGACYYYSRVFVLSAHLVYRILLQWLCRCPCSNPWRWQFFHPAWPYSCTYCWTLFPLRGLPTYILLYNNIDMHIKQIFTHIIR